MKTDNSNIVVEKSESDYVYIEDFHKVWKCPYKDESDLKTRIKLLEERLYSNEWALNEVRATRTLQNKLLKVADQQYKDLVHSHAELLVAAKGVLASWDKSMMGDIETHKSTEWGDYWSPAQAMVNSENINQLRLILQKLNIQ